jgi:hypothetical protein
VSVLDGDTDADGDAQLPRLECGAACIPTFSNSDRRARMAAGRIDQ